MAEKMTPEEFADKVEWEGDVIEALEYGLTAEDLVDGPLKTAWGRLEEAWKDFKPALDAVEELLDEARGFDE
jgi:hypothetical protein